MIKFNQNNVTDGTAKARVSYSVCKKHNDPRQCVTIYAKEYGRQLSPIFDDVSNDTDMMTDYFEKDRITFFEGDKYYAEAFAAHIAKCDAEIAKCEKRHAKRHGTDQAANLRQMVAGK